MIAADDVLATLRVVDLPLRRRFRGIVRREAALFQGPEGWTEFSPFVEYDDEESSRWLAAAVEFGWRPSPDPLRSSIPVNATVPAVPAEQVVEVLAGFPGCRTVKVKVAEPGQSGAEDVARVAAVRAALGPEGRIRVDANGRWNVDEAERAVHALAPYDLEYLEQPCTELGELIELGRRIRYLDVPIALDEAVRKAEDPQAAERAGAGAVLVVKAAPLGGIRAALGLAAGSRLPVVVSSALETSVGLAMGAHLAAALAELPFDCGLGTAALLAADVTADPLLPVAGEIPVRRTTPDESLLERWAADAERTQWWRERITRCLALLERAQRPE
ncbi:MAG: O-succinylbenzoate synthase [Naasia sp.]|uniref:o-succinylbenzoate synthase n=1 Tax=Naasia sp. TaxID=2546198 RepID=UPI00260A27E3|nr:o-succinylbenzoate synthase [Naasia sp.]MCU1570648.1 O-succinylbenzoate synthase [Naasia sp.]